MIAIDESRDGGHHALKGFVFQFDSSLLRIYENPSADVQIEGIQDLSVDEYYIQIKHRTRNFSLSLIKDAVNQMIKQYSLDRSRRFLLYGYFLDTVPGDERWLELEELRKLSKEYSDEYSEDLLMEFSKNFHIQFSANYQSQFGHVLDTLMQAYHLSTKVEALKYHAIIHRFLVDLVLNNPSGRRVVSTNILDDVVKEAQSTLFLSAYQRIYGNAKYVRLLREEFRQRRINVPKRERLIIVQSGKNSNLHDLVDIALHVKSRYHRKSDSVPAYLIFRGTDRMPILKKMILDSGVLIFDGTHFDGDKQQLGNLLNPNGMRRVELKVTGEENLHGLLQQVGFSDVYDFFLDIPAVTPKTGAYGCRIHSWYVEKPSDVAQILR
ncbi:hypothetical protein ACIQM0_01470 [Streptomyces sp. NPDC091387]|uniref:hypothetical protein n=1 Tax=Streptomyces sp. NPDC091387 TaxID=3365998 RepID=UPI0038038B6A